MCIKIKIKIKIHVNDLSLVIFNVGWAKDPQHAAPLGIPVRGRLTAIPNTNPTHTLNLTLYLCIIWEVKETLLE